MRQVYVMVGWRRPPFWKAFNSKMACVGGMGRIIGISFGYFWIQLDMLP